MNSRDHLSQDLETLIKRTKQIGYVAWAVAILVMVFGTPIVFDFLTDHDIPGSVAWMLSLAADGALIVGLIATPVLAQLGVPAGWVGTLRYVAGFSTWALQSAGSWFHQGGVDGVGVAAHSVGPILLFFAVEAASSFQRKVAEALTGKARELERVEQRDADQRAHLAEVESNLRALTAELETANRKAADLANQLDAVYADRDGERSTATLTAERYEKEIGELRLALSADRERLTGERDEAVRRLTAEHEEATRKLKERHREALTAARTDSGAVSLTAYRNRATGKAAPALTGKPVLSDEAAVQMMLDAHDDPDFEWSQNAVRTLTGVGLDRAKKLIPMWLTAVTGEGEAVNQ